MVKGWTNNEFDIPGGLTIGGNIVNTDMRYTANRVENIGFSYAGGTGVFTVHAADGTALSAANPGYVCLKSNGVNGQLVLYTITANQTFIDDIGASEIIGNLFGLTTAVATSVDVPFFLYACSNDLQDTITFGLSRIPHIVVAPAVANLGSPASATADVDIGIFLLESVTLGDYDANPVLPIGSFRMRMSVLNDWTVQPLDNEDGIGRWNDSRDFSGMAGQFGADSGTFVLPNGGTPPVFINNEQNYMITPDGYCYVNYSSRQDGGTDGSGAVIARVQLPYTVLNILGSFGGQMPTSCLVYRGNGPNEVGILNPISITNYAIINRMATTVNDKYEWQDFGNGNRTIAFSMYYKVRNA